MKRGLSIILLSFSLFSLAVYADGLCPDIEFKGPISSVVIDSEGVGALFITVNNIQIRVQVENQTELTDGSGQAIKVFFPSLAVL